MVQHKAVHAALPAAPPLPHQTRTPDSLPLALGTALRAIHLNGMMTRSIHADVEAMILFTSFLEKRLHLHHVEEIRQAHVSAFVQSPIAQKPGNDRTFVERRRTRAYGAQLLLSSIAQSTTTWRRCGR